MERALGWAKEHRCDSVSIEVVNHRTDLFDGKGGGYYGQLGFNLIGTAPCDAAHNCDESKLTRPAHFLLLHKAVDRL